MCMCEKNLISKSVRFYGFSPLVVHKKHVNITINFYSVHDNKTSNSPN
jgi:hypothetical protein